MVNLLFISNNSKMDTIKKILQPLLKVKIDLVSDFDYGLKDVFEKRPATVFIQDQIAGVTGESVARHIQMLLGSGSPSFIFMHDGSVKAKPINGLFEHLIDLSQMEVKIVEDIQAILKSLLGTQWEKIIIPPKIDRAAIRSAVAVPEGSRAFADQLVDDFISDLDNFGLASTENRGQAPDISDKMTPVDEPALVVLSPHDQLAEMLSENCGSASYSEAPDVTAYENLTKKPTVPAQTAGIAQQDPQTAVPKKTKAVVSTLDHDLKHPQPAISDLESSVPLISTIHGNDEVPPAPQPMPDKSQQQVSPADFIISGERSPTEGVAPEDLLHVFDENHYSHSGSWERYVTIAVVLAVCAGGGFWYLWKQKPHLLTYITRSSTKSAVEVPAKRTVKPAISIQKPVSTSALKKGAVSALPSFIAHARLDSSYASRNPGWERYIGTTLEFRVYRDDGKIKAVQVLGVNNHDISEPALKSILNELVKDGEYRVKSDEQKFGYNVSRAIVGQKSELLIYRKKTSIRAFVVSLN